MYGGVKAIHTLGGCGGAGKHPLSCWEKQNCGCVLGMVWERKNALQRIFCKTLFFLVGAEGLEPPTLGL